MPEIGPRRRDALVLALLFAIGSALYAPVIAIRPLDGDNLYVLAWVHSARFADLLRLDPVIYPEWRPLAYLTIWLEHRIVPIEAAGLHLLVNVCLWIGCAFAIYRIVLDLTASLPASVFAALILFLDRRAASALTWIVERQMLMATLLGVLALGIVIRARGRDTTPREATAIGVLLVASALSKEYGLACAFAIGAFAFAVRRVHTSVAALSACTVYGAMRLAFAGGAVAPYCEDMGFLFTSDFQCINPVTPAGLGQMAYNATASTVAIALSGLFASDGTVNPSVARLMISLAFTAFAALGILRGPRIMGSVAMLPIATGVLSVMLFRPRNQLIGVAGIAILAGVGMASVRLRMMPPWLRAPALAAMAALIAVLLCGKAYLAETAVSQRVESLLMGNPCTDDNVERPFIGRFVPMVRNAYALGDPECRAWRDLN
jgi:hypothetical protein